MVRLHSLGAKLAFVAILFPLAARAEWKVAARERKPGAVAALEYRRYSLGESNSGAETEIQCAIFSPERATLRLIDQPDFASDLAEVVPRVGGVAGVNGGYFAPDGAPVGLLRSDGKTLAKIQRARLVGGVLAIAPSSIELLRANAFAQKRNWSAALQCGPFLIERGKTVAGLEKTRSARRSFVALLPKAAVAIGYCEAATLAQLADALAALSDLQIVRAMNLDGGSSSAFFCLTKSGAVSIPEEKRVRDFLVVVPKDFR